MKVISGYANNNYVYTCTDGNGTGAIAQISVSGGVVTSCTILNYGKRYAVGDVLSASISGGTGFTYTITALTKPPAGSKLYCIDCTANDASAGVDQTWNGSTFKNA